MFAAMTILMLFVLMILPLPFATAEAVEKTSVLIMFKQKVDRSLIEDHGGTVKIQYRYHPAVSADLPRKAIDALSKSPNIEHIIEDIPPELVYQTVPWGIQKIGALTVHSGGNRGEGVNVAVLDTGIDTDHPDLSYVWGYDFYGSNDPNVEDGHGHGTHVAGIIAARDNTIGVVGVAPNADLYILKVFDDSGNAKGYGDIIEAFEWCIDTYKDAIVGNEIQVISMSWGSSYSAGDPGIHPWITDLYNLGVILVGASGNEGLFSLPIDTVIYPARYSEVIAVGATDENNILAWFSSCGPAVELVAPGVAVVSTYPDKSYYSMDGTSMAAPHVSGTAALVLASRIDSSYDYDHDGVWDNNEVRKKLQMTADDLYTPGRDVCYGYGLVDADEAANTGPAPPPAPNTPPTAIVDSITPNPADYGAAVSFTGHGDDSDGTIIAYSWRSSIDGQLSMSQSFSTSSLSSGTHTIYFKVQDDDGAWSTEAAQTLTINKPPTPEGYIYVESIDFKKTRSRLDVYVKISDHTGRPYPGAVVTISVMFPDGHTESKPKTTDSKGVAKWWITFPPKGTYTVTVTGVHDTLPYHPEYNKETTESYAV